MELMKIYEYEINYVNAWDPSQDEEIWKREGQSLLILYNGFVLSINLCKKYHSIG